LAEVLETNAEMVCASDLLREFHLEDGYFINRAPSAFPFVASARAVNEVLAGQNVIDHNTMMVRRGFLPTWPTSPVAWRHPDWLAWKDLAARTLSLRWGFLPSYGAILTVSPWDIGNSVGRGLDLAEIFRSKECLL
jgi:hypothetical protein